jgi:hypothetical protein
MTTLEFSITTMEELQMVVLHTFYHGKDYFGETALGFGDFFYSKTGRHWVQNIYLKQTDGHPCTSGIGIYVEGDMIKFFSSKWVFQTKLTYEIEKELNKVKELDATAA